MKRNKTILIVILIVLVAAYFVLRTRRPEEKHKNIFAIDSLAIASIEVFDAADTLVLEKQNNLWMLTHPVNWEADAARMQSLFKDVLLAEYPKTPMGKGAAAVNRYKLQDSLALNIVVGDKSGKKRIHAQFSNLGNPYDYFRYAGSNEVYQIKSKVANIYTTELPMWRSPHVVQYEEEELLSIDVKHIRNTYTLTRKEYDWYYKDAQNDFKIPPANRGIMKIVHVLSSLDTYVFIDDGSLTKAERFKTPECLVTLHLSKNRTQTLNFVKYDDSQYLLMVNNDPSVLFMVSFDTVFRFMRHADVFRITDF